MAKYHAHEISTVDLLNQSYFPWFSSIKALNHTHDYQKLTNALEAAEITYSEAIHQTRSMIFTEVKNLIIDINQSLNPLDKLQDSLTKRILIEELGNILECPEIVVTAQSLFNRSTSYLLTKAAIPLTGESTPKKIDQQIFYLQRLIERLENRLTLLQNESIQLKKNHALSTSVQNKGYETSYILDHLLKIKEQLKKAREFIDDCETAFEKAAEAIEKEREASFLSLLAEFEQNKDYLLEFVNEHRKTHGLFNLPYSVNTDKKTLEDYLYQQGFINRPLTAPQNSLNLIRLSLRNGLASPMRYLLTDSLLAYSDTNPIRYGIKQIVDQLNKIDVAKDTTWQKAEKDIVAIIKLLRGAHRAELIRLYYQTLAACPSNANKSEEEILQNFFLNLENLFIQLAYPDPSHHRRKAKLISFYHIQGFDRLKDPNRLRQINDSLYLNKLKKHINHLFDKYGHNHHIDRVVKQQIPEYAIVPNRGISYHKQRLRRKKSGWKLVGDVVTILNTVGQAAFACWGLLATGNPLFLLILVAAFVTNFYLFLSSQRTTFIDLFVQWNASQLSLVKKIALGLTFVASLLSGLFFASMAYGGALALLAIPGAQVLAFLIGCITFIGFTSLLFATFKTYIVNESYKAAWHFFRENFLFKGFWSMTLGQRISYILGWGIRAVVMALSVAATTLYIAATLGKCYDTVANLFPKIPATLNAIFSILGGLIDMFFALQSVIPLTMGMAKYMMTIGSALILHPITCCKWFINATKGVFKKLFTKSKTIEGSIEEDPSFWHSVGGEQDTLANNPERFILPLTKIAFYVLVILFLVPTNAMGNATTNESAGGTLIDKLDQLGFPHFSEYILDQIILLSTLLCSSAITVTTAHPSIIKSNPDMEPDPHFVFDAKTNRDALRNAAQANFTATDPMTAKAIQHFTDYQLLSCRQRADYFNLTSSPINSHIEPLISIGPR